MDETSASAPSPLGIYLHIPFCRAKCAYCDFASYADLTALQQPYLHALQAELRAWAAQHGRLPADTVFFGGGTPTIVPTHLLVELLQAVRQAFVLAPQAEISVEANPGTVSRDALLALRRAGVNRLSLGVQSLRDPELRLLGRIHGASEACAAVDLARDTGMDNLNLDLIYGLPGQTLAHWTASLDRALALAPEHLSLYALSVEAGTPLQERIACGQLSEPNPDLAADMYQATEARLAASGYVHYELSNWARPPSGGSEPAVCRHNLKYWQRAPYLGFGSSASSLWSACRWTNVRHPQAYIDRLQAGLPAHEPVEQLSPVEERAEAIILGLRLLDGIPFADFTSRYGVDLRQAYAAQLDELTALSLLESDATHVRLTPRGRLLANRAFAYFWPPPTS